MTYDVGSIVEYRLPGGGLRRVSVTDAHTPSDEGPLTFGGFVLDWQDEPTSARAWGYEDQIVRVDGQ